jgi:DNA-binding transcriptional regulator/RsmH inhibitor MraZ
MMAEPSIGEHEREMLLPLDADIFESGFYFGQYDPKIDDESRLHLPKEVVDLLREHGVRNLYRCPDPTGERFILCPGAHWPTFVEAVKKLFAESPDLGKAVRFLCSGTAAWVDLQGRIRITKACLDHAKIKVGQRVNMLGVGKWYEVSGR